MVSNVNLTQTAFVCKICGSEVKFSVNNPNSYISKREHDTFFGMNLFSFRVQHEIENERHINSVIVDSKGLYRGHLDAYAERLVEENLTDGYYLETVEETQELPRKPLIFFYLYDLSSHLLLEFISAEGMNLKVLFSQVLKRIHEFQQLYETKNFFETEFADLRIQIILDGNLAFFFALEKPHDDLKLALREILCRYSEEGFIQISTLILLLHILCNSDEVDFEVLNKLLKTDLIRVHVKTDLRDYIPKIAQKLASEFPIAIDEIVEVLSGEKTVYDLILHEPQLYHEICRMVEFTNRRKLLG